MRSDKFSILQKEMNSRAEVLRLVRRPTSSDFRTKRPAPDQKPNKHRVGNSTKIHLRHCGAGKHKSCKHETNQTGTTHATMEPFSRLQQLMKEHPSKSTGPTPRDDGAVFRLQQLTMEHPSNRTGPGPFPRDDGAVFRLQQLKKGHPSKSSGFPHVTTEPVQGSNKRRHACAEETSPVYTTGPGRR